MGFLNELAGWAHIANVNIHDVFSSKDDTSTTIEHVNKNKKTHAMIHNYNKATNMGADYNSAKAYAAIVEAMDDGKFEIQSVIPENASLLKTVLDGFGYSFSLDDVMSAIYVCDVISFVESKGIDLSIRDDNLIRVSKYISTCNGQVTPDEVAKNTGVPVDSINTYFDLLNEYASRNKALHKPFTINPPVQPQQVPVSDPTSQSKNSRKNSKAQQPAAAQ